MVFGKDEDFRGAKETMKILRVLAIQIDKIDQSLL